MTKEELKEAIAATITENGQKGITGQALANLLNEIVDAAGSGGGSGEGGNAGGGGLMIDPAGMVGPNEHNAQVRQVLIDGLNNGVAYPVRMTGFEQGNGEPAVVNCSVYLYTLSEDMFILQLSELPDMTLLFNEDGSLSVEG